VSRFCLFCPAYALLASSKVLCSCYQCSHSPSGQNTIQAKYFRAYRVIVLSHCIHIPLSTYEDYSSVHLSKTLLGPIDQLYITARAPHENRVAG
jgi:hypothetical protein